MRKLLKKKSFWIAVSGAAVIILQICGIKIDAPLVNEIILGVCSLLVAVGFMTASDRTEIKKGLDKDETKETGQKIPEENSEEKKE